VKQSKGFQVKGQENKAYKLKKTLYGLKRTQRTWYDRIDDYLLKIGFIKSPSETTFYVKMTGSKVLQMFKMTNLGLMSFFF